MEAAMSRLPRLYAPGYAHHIIQRGNNRTPCFFEEADRWRYLAFLVEASMKHQVAIHAYVLMKNHVHMLVSPQTAESCGRMMQSLGRRYVRYFNDRYQRSGTLWEGRYKSTLIDNHKYFFAVARYIEMNPVRAAMVKNPADYQWSSYMANGHGKYDALLTPHKLYLDLGCDGSRRQREYQMLFEHDVNQQLEDELRETTNKGWAFGSETFKAELQKTANRPFESAGWGGDRRSKGGGTNQGL